VGESGGGSGGSGLGVGSFGVHWWVLFDLGGLHMAVWEFFREGTGGVGIGPPAEEMGCFLVWGWVGGSPPPGGVRKFFEDSLAGPSG